MAWFYAQTASHSGVDPALANDTHAGKLSEYQFFQSTDANAIKFYSALVTGHGPLYGPYGSLADAQAQAAKTKPESPGAFTTDLLAPPSALQIPGLDSIGNAVEGVAGFVGALTDPHTWVRIAEVVLGLVLIAVGIAKLTNAVPIATRIAGRAARVGAVAAL